MSSGVMPVKVGGLHLSLTSAMAERAITVANNYSRSSRAKFMLGVDIAGDVFVGRPGDVHPKQWIATFTRRSCPDWLEEQIVYEKAVRS